MHISLPRLFFAFTQIGISAFGSTVVYARRVVVEDWRWMTREEFLDTWALSQLVPGPNMVNWAVCAGARFRGPAGALVAVLGLVTAPVCIALALAVLYTIYGNVPEVNAALRGIAAAAAGLLFATAVKMAVTPRMRSWLAVFAILAFVTVGLARMSLVLALALLIPLSIVGAWLKARLENR
jgi:chromate transporter